MPNATTLLVILAKRPAAGRVKTRLCPPLLPQQAAQLAEAFIIDTCSSLGEVQGCERILCLDQPWTASSIATIDLWQQVDGDLGQRIEDVVMRGLQRASVVLVVGTDAPGLPPPLFEHAIALLQSSDAVLGPAVDGGYYLIGFTRFEPGLLAGLPWSTPHTLSSTLQRLRSRSYRVQELPCWFDVDDAADLKKLRMMLKRGAICAPATSRVLESFE